MISAAAEAPKRAHRERAVLCLVSAVAAFLVAIDLRPMLDVSVAVGAGTLAGTALLYVPPRRRKKERAMTKVAVLVLLARVAATTGAILLPALALGAGGFGALATSMLLCGIQAGVLAARATPPSAA
jgi:hypothetical protein